MAIIKVKTGGITADAITDALIADDVVGTEHLTANEVDTTALGADAVTGAQLADNAVNSEHYTDGSVDTAHIADAQITTAKLSTAVFTGATDIGADLADADLILVDDGAGGTLRKSAASRLKTYVGYNTPRILAVSNTSQTVSDNTSTKITNLNTQPINTGGTWDSSNHRWTPGVAGTYYLAGQTSINLNNAGSYLQVMIYKNGSVASYYQVVAEGTNATYTSKTTFIDTADTDDYYELFIRHNSGGNSTVNYDSAAKYTHFFGYKLIG